MLNMKRLLVITKIFKCDELAIALLRIEILLPSFLPSPLPQNLDENQNLDKQVNSNVNKEFLPIILPKKSSQKNPPKKSFQRKSFGKIP